MVCSDVEFVLPLRSAISIPVTLVLIDRERPFARRLVVPDRHFGEARRVLRDKIAVHDIHFTGKSLDLSEHDERDVV